MNNCHWAKVQKRVAGGILTAALTFAAVACGTSSSQPSLSGEVAATANPLVAQYMISPSRDAHVAVEFGLDTSYGFQTSPQPTPPGGGSTTVLVAGMQQNSTYHMRAVVTFANGGQVVDSDHTFTTGAAPAGRIPKLTITTPAGISAAPGVELVGLNPGTSNQLLIEAVDPAGNLIWYYDYDPTLGTATPIKLLPNGHFLVLLSPGNEQAGTVREIDLAGNTIHQFTRDDLNQWLATAGDNLKIAGIHHDFVALDNGHLLLLVSLDKTFTDLPGYPGPTVVQGDAIVDLDASLKPVWVWSTFDHLDVNRHPMNFPDWTHCNALLYLDDGNLLLSVRHQSWLLKIDYANGQGSGDILWKLGYQGDFTLASGAPANWFYAQHYPDIISPNSTGDFLLAVFDNGDNRVLDASGTTCGSAGAAACYSRPAVFEVNEAARTAQLNWAYNTVYSYWGGAVQELPNTNIFFNMSTPSNDSTGARAMELTQEATPQVIWQLEVTGQNSYRTIHLPSLYPQVQW